VAIATVLAGCQTVTSRHVEPDVTLDSRATSADGGVDRTALEADVNARGTADATASSAGITYFLPRQLARVTATRTDLRLEALIAGVVKAQSELDSARATLTAARAALTSTEQSIINGAGGAPAQAILATRIATHQAEVDAATRALAGKQDALDKAKALLRVSAAVVTAQTEVDAQLADRASVAEHIRQTNISITAGRDAEGRITDLRNTLDARNAELTSASESESPDQARVAQATIAADMARRAVDNAQAAIDRLPTLRARLATLEGQSTGLTQVNSNGRTAREVALDLARSTFTTVTGAEPPSANAPPRFKVTLKLELLAPTADPANAYRLSPRHSVLRDDTHDFVVSPGGLLTSTNTIAVDRTADILVEIGTFAGAISGLSAGGGAGIMALDGGADEPEPCREVPNEFTGVVDFTNMTAVAQLNAHMECLGVRTQVTGQAWSNSGRPVSNASRGIDGIVYRNPVEVEVQIEKCFDINGACRAGSPDWRVTEVIALALPQAGPISYVPQDAGFMTRTQYELAFKDGILTSYDASRPSEVFHAVAAPMRIVEGVFAGASRVLSLRTGQNTALAELSASELAVLNANIGLQAGQINGQTTLSNARVAALNAEFALRAAQLGGETGLTNAQTTALNAEYALRLAQINGETGVQTAQTNSQTSLNTGQLSFLQSQVTLATGSNSAAAQLLASDLALTVAQLRDQARREALSRCIAQQQSLGAPIDACLVGL
jgi:hypothetical protein